jgi:hypothetical protein
MPFYDYRVMRVGTVASMIELPMMPDAYISESKETKALRLLLSHGYRWIRTDGEFAVFENAFPSYEAWLQFTNTLATAATKPPTQTLCQQ